CAVANGAVGVRIDGAERIRATRRRTGVPIVGIAKRRVAGFEPYITPGLADIAPLVDAGADVIALDATARARPDGSTLAEAVRAIHRLGALAMADCATTLEAARAAEAGADILATTLCGYTPETLGTPLPAFELVRMIGPLGFTICEGGVG